MKKQSTKPNVQRHPETEKQADNQTKTLKKSTKAEPELTSFSHQQSTHMNKYGLQPFSELEIEYPEE